MNDINDYRLIADRFATIAQEYCTAIDSASATERTDFLIKIYRILPRLIGEAVELPAVSLSDDDEDLPRTDRLTHAQWDQLYNLLKEKLGDWDHYMQVFDPTADKAADLGSLADDLADVYRDLRDGLGLSQNSTVPAKVLIWDWRLDYYSHWAHHAMNALQTIHFRLQDILE